VGDWDTMEVSFMAVLCNTYIAHVWLCLQSLLECDSIPAEILEQNPTIMTFTKVSCPLCIISYEINSHHNNAAHMCCLKVFANAVRVA
jgi:hypothetical protein